MNKRVKELRISLNMSQADFAGRLGVSNAALSKIESGVNSVSDRMVISICKEYGVNETWLRSGEGDMFSQSEDDRIIMRYAKQLIDDADPHAELKRRILVNMAKLTADQWDAVEALIKELAGT